MTPKDQSILKTLNLLVMLSKSKKLLSFGMPEEEKYALTITKQNLTDSDLTLPEFTNTLDTIAKKGYVWHTIIHDENLRSQINDFKNRDDYQDILTALKKLDTPEISNKLNEGSAKEFNKMLPKNTDFDFSENSKDSPTSSELFLGGLEILNKMNPDEIGLVLLMPFRNVEILFNKVNDGKNFDDIQDDGFWYDESKYEFHIDGKIIKASVRDMPNLSHSVLSSFFSNPDVTKVDYEEMPDFDSSKGNESYRDAMRKFISKDPKLQQMFSVHLYHTDFNPENYNK